MRGDELERADIDGLAVQDDVSALDLGTVKAWALIVRLAVAEYLGLDPELNQRARRSVEELVSDPLLYN